MWIITIVQALLLAIYRSYKHYISVAIKRIFTAWRIACECDVCYHDFKRISVISVRRSYIIHARSGVMKRLQSAIANVHYSQTLSLTFAMIDFVYHIFELSNSFFREICNPNSCLNYLLPPKRDTSVTSRLTAATPYPRPTLRTKKYCSLINYGLSHYQ